MNSAPNQSGSQYNNNTSQTGTQNNPFVTNDLKGEFTSKFGATNDFGGATGATNVSQIFKDGSYGGDNTKKYLMIGVILACLAGLAWMFLGGSGETEIPATVDTPAVETPEAKDPLAVDPNATTAATPEAGAATAENPATDPATDAGATADPAATGATGPITLSAPESGASMPYDETQGSASFSWSGGPGTIVFSRNSSMQPEVMRVNVSGTSYSFHRPWPGQWYWKVETEGGASEVRSFSVQAPVRRNIALTAPQSGASLAGTGGAVTWTGDSNVAYYRVELNQTDDWSNPQFKFSSSGSQLQLNGVPAGSYNLRLGAFSEVAGRWEYTTPVQVTVQ
jgi:hypothetical protein